MEPVGESKRAQMRLIPVCTSGARAHRLRLHTRLASTSLFRLPMRRGGGRAGSTFVKRRPRLCVVIGATTDDEEEQGM